MLHPTREPDLLPWSPTPLLFLCLSPSLQVVTVQFSPVPVPGEEQGDSAQEDQVEQGEREL